MHAYIYANPPCMMQVTNLIGPYITSGAFDCIGSRIIKGVALISIIVYQFAWVVRALLLHDMHIDGESASVLPGSNGVIEETLRLWSY